MDAGPLGDADTPTPASDPDDDAIPDATPSHTSWVIMASCSGVNGLEPASTPLS